MNILDRIKRPGTSKETNIKKASITCPITLIPDSSTLPTDDRILNSLQNIQALLRALTANIQKIGAGTDDNRTRWYDKTFTIAAAEINQLPASSTSYSYAQINLLMKHNVPIVRIYNDGPGTLYVRSTNDGETWDDEFPVYEGEMKPYLNIYDIASRAPIAGLRYRITEHELLKQKNIEYFSGNPYIYETFVAAAGTPNIHDIKDGNSTINGASVTESQALRRNAHSGYLENKGPGNLLIEFNDGLTYSPVRTLAPTQTQPLDAMDMAKLRIDASLNNTFYYLGAQ